MIVSSLRAHRNEKWDSLSKKLINEPNNFVLWQNLIEEAENNLGEGINKSSSSYAIELAEASYIKFLEKYTLYEKYWHRYAEMLFRLGNTSKAESIYETALENMPYSLFLWESYLQLSIKTKSAEIDGTLVLFERARKKIGYHYYADGFYKLYLSFLKSYSDGRNGFIKKYYILLRLIVEIPLYNYEYFAKLLFQEIHERNLNENTIRNIVPQQHLKSYLEVDDIRTASLKLKKIFTDVYITTQFKSYQLYGFERHLTRQYFHVSYLSNNELSYWDTYLNFLELNYNSEIVVLNYERCIVCSGNYYKFWIRYANFYISQKRYISAKEVLYRSLRIQHSDQALIKIIDLEIFTGNLLKAHDLIVSHIRANNSPSVNCFQKLISVERLKSGNDEAIGTLFRAILKQTKNDYFFKILSHYNLPGETLRQIYEEFENEFATSKLYWESLIINNRRCGFDVHNVLAKCKISLPRRDFEKIDRQLDAKDQTPNFEKQFYEHLNSVIDQS